jgi:poly [ADP-ribose] polymerase
VRSKEWVNGSWCSGQDDLLAALESAVTMSAADDAGTDALPIIFRHTLTELDRYSQISWALPRSSIARAIPCMTPTG